MLGTADSQLGNIILGELGGDNVVSQSIQLRANILAVSTETIQLRANILGVSSESLQMRANINFGASFEMRAFIALSAPLEMRACILQTIEADLNVTFDAIMPLDQWLLVRYRVGDKDPNYKAFQARARILQAISANMTVRYEVDYNGMPTNCIGRPKTRVYLRTVREFCMRARIEQ